VQLLKPRIMLLIVVTTLARWCSPRRSAGERVVATVLGMMRERRSSVLNHCPTATSTRS